MTLELTNLAKRIFDSIIALSGWMKIWWFVKGVLVTFVATISDTVAGKEERWSILVGMVAKDASRRERLKGGGSMRLADVWYESGV